MYLLTPEEIFMSDWKDLFQEHILDRGESYYFDGAVLELHKTEHGYHGVVEGDGGLRSRY